MKTIDFNLSEGDDCRSLFRKAYENRYTWSNDFKGYKGSCSLEDQDSIHQGLFCLGADNKVNIENIDNEEINKLISSQLWEVAIHRVKRKFEVVHKENTFTAGKVNELGLEVLVGGKNSGDKYIIKDDIIKMVYRNIHGSLINIYTIETINTGNGYLSSVYTSQYLDSSTKRPKNGISKIKDEFVRLETSGIWTLSIREIETNEFEKTQYSKKKFIFKDLCENF